MCVTSKPQLLWAGFLRPIPVRVKRKALTSGELPARWEIIQLPALKKLKGGQNLLRCSLQNFKENQVPTWNNRIFGFLFMSWTFFFNSPTSAGFFNSSIVADVPYWEHIRGFFFFPLFFSPHWTLLNTDPSKSTITSQKVQSWNYREFAIGMISIF